MAKSLVTRGLSGDLEPLTERPEQAALALLDLTHEQLQPIDAMFEKRAVAVSKIQREHRDVFLKIQAGLQGGAPPEELRPLMRQMRELAGELLDPPLEERVRDLLPESKREAFTGFVEEYLRASAEAMAAQRGDRTGAEAQSDPRPQDADAGPRSRRDRPRTMGRERQEMSMFLREVARSLNALVVSRREQMEALLKAVEATPEQEEKLRAIVRAAGEAEQRNAGRATEEQRRETWRKMMDVLTREQRVKALQLRMNGG